MVRPASFGFNAETAGSNVFQRAAVAGEAFAERARAEFDAAARELDRAGVRVVVVEDTAEPAKPDAVFPNNWVSFHADGTVVLYPMLAPNRRAERRDDVVRRAAAATGFTPTRVVDLSGAEAAGCYLEGTGSLVLDRVRRIAFAALSPRTHRAPLEDFGRRLDYQIVAFDTRDGAGTPVYHTNVLLAVGSRFAVLCEEVIPSAEQRATVRERLEAGGHAVLVIDAAQMAGFAANLLELATPAGPVIALSRTAWEVLDSPRRRRLEAHGSLLALDVPTIERLGGGSVRCMLAEVPAPAA